MKRQFTLLAPVVAVFALAATALPVQAQEGTLLKNVLGTLGIIDSEREPIDYRERPPLVVPPKMDLRQPVDPSSVALRDPSWPKDPDVLAKRKAAEEARRPVRNPGDNTVAQGARLTPEEIRAGRVAGTAVTEPQRTPGDNSREAILVPPDQLRSQGRKLKDDPTLIPGVEPKRAALTEPPPGYRLPAANGPLTATKDGPDIRDDREDAIGFFRKLLNQ